MQWKNLQEKLCPKCQEPLIYDEEAEMYNCSDCDFAISEDRFISLLEDLDSQTPRHLRGAEAIEWNNER